MYFVDNKYHGAESLMGSVHVSFSLCSNSEFASVNYLISRVLQ